MARILIVDDHSVMREGLKLMVRRSFDDAMIGEAKNAQAALQELRRHPWDLAIFDISMPGRSGLDIIKEAKQLSPKLGIVVFSMFDETIYAERAFRAGASAYISKDKAPEELILALNKVINGGYYVSASLAERLASLLGQNKPGRRHETLSDREFEVLRLIASGKKPHVIAEILHLSVKTVNTYRQRVLEKTQLESTTDLIIYSIHNKLIE